MSKLAPQHHFKLFRIYTYSWKEVSNVKEAAPRVKMEPFKRQPKNYLKELFKGQPKWCKTWESSLLPVDTWWGNGPLGSPSWKSRGPGHCLCSLSRIHSYPYPYPHPPHPHPHLIQFNVWILPKYDSINIWFNIALPKIQYKILFNSKKICWFNSKDNSIQ